VNRWRARLAELQSDASALPAHVQNVQNVQKSPSASASEHFEQFDQPGPAAQDDRTDTEEERSAIVEYDGGVPRDWAEAMARLDPRKPPSDVPPRRWLRFIDDCGRFLDGGWAPRAQNSAGGHSIYSAAIGSGLSPGWIT
jgi:hypothetical protein